MQCHYIVIFGKIIPKIFILCQHVTVIAMNSLDKQCNQMLH